MRKLFFAAIIIACAAPFTFAQSDDYNKAEGAVLFSHNRVDTGIADEDDDDFDDIIDQREGFNGFNASVTGNLSRYFGVKGDYAFHRKSFSIDTGVAAFPTVDIKANLHTFVGGVQIKDNSRETKVKPFAHVLAGVAHNRAESNTTGFGFEDSETGFAAAIGGGVDFRLSDRVDLRAVQFDYNPTRSGGDTGHNFRVGIGIIFR